MSLYWKCQLAGWSSAALYWAFLGLTGGRFILSVGIVQFVLDVAMYIGVTHLFRLFSRRMGWGELPPKALLVRIIPAVILLGLAFMVVTIAKVYLVSYYMVPRFDQPFGAFRRQYAFPMFITGVRLMSIWVLAYYLYHYARRELLAKDARFNQLRAQLNPHFFFNSLNSIKALINVDPPSARRAVDLLSDLLRNSLYEGEKSEVPLGEEISLVKDYLELEKMRFDKRLQVCLQVEEGLWKVPVLPLSIQPLVENAIKHGIAPRVAGGIVEIRVESLDDNIKATVSNPGKLSPGHEGLGLRNLTERLQLRYPGRATFELVQQTDNTVQAILIFPRQ
jgi:hypothetical protein